MSRATLPITRFTFDEYARLVEADVFAGARVELLNGRIYRMPPQKSPHMAAISKTAAALERVRGQNEWIVIQGTLRLDRYAAPDPDLMWLPVPIGTPQHLWPLPLLLIEVSETTYRKDSGVKLRKYAHAGIAEYWIENLAKDRIEVYRNPRNPTGNVRDCAYDPPLIFTRGQSIAVAAHPGISLAVDDLLP